MEVSIVCLVLLRESVSPAILSEGSLLTSFNIYQLSQNPSSCTIAIQLAVTYLVSVLHLMDWNTKVSLMI